MSMTSKIGSVRLASETDAWCHCLEYWATNQWLGYIVMPSSFKNLLVIISNRITNNPDVGRVIVVVLQEVAHNRLDGITDSTKTTM